MFILFLPSSLSQGQKIENQGPMNTSVLLAPNILISIKPSGVSFCPPENITLTTNLTNVGNLATVGNLTTEVLDPYGRLFMNGSWNNTVLNPDDEKSFVLWHQVTGDDQPGIYQMKSNFSYDNKYVYASDTFRIKQKIGTLVASPSTIEETVMPGDTIVKYLYIWLVFPCYGTNVFLNTTPGPPGDWVIFSSNPVWVSPEIANVTVVYVYINLPSNTTSADYTGSINLWAEDQHVIIPLIIHVKQAPIFDVITEVLSQYKEVCIGSDVTAKVTVTKIFPPDTLDVNLTYRIEFNSTTYAERKETVAVTTSIQKDITLTTPSSLPEGYYLFSTTLNIDDTVVYSYDLFYAKSCPFPPPPQPPPTGGVALPTIEKPPPPLSLELSRYRLYAILGNTTGFIAKVKNMRSEETKAIRLDVSGVPIEWLKITPYRFNLNPNETNNFIVTIDIPADAEEGIYYLNIRATDAYKSEEKQLALIIAKDMKSLARLALEHAENLANRARQIKFLNCLEIGDLLKDLEDSEMVLKSAKEEYNFGRYGNVISLADFASDSFEKIITKANSLIENAFRKLPTFIFSPFSGEFEKEIRILERLTVEKTYVGFCGSLKKIQNLSLYSTIEVIAIVSLIAVSVLILIEIFRKRKEVEVAAILRRVRERLGIETE
jgi:hypothetical protein